MPNPILVLYAHPGAHLSRVNRRLADAARALPGVRVHDLYDSYPDFSIDVAHEQGLAAAAAMIVLLHPVQWFSMPSLQKEWLDAVLLPGWAHGEHGTALAGKTCWLVATTGHAAQGHGRPFADFLPPYQQTAALCGMHWAEPHILHGAHLATEERVAAHVECFRARLAAFAAQGEA